MGGLVIGAKKIFPAETLQKFKLPPPHADDDTEGEQHCARSFLLSSSFSPVVVPPP